MNAKWFRTVLALAAVVATAGAFWLSHRPVPVTKVSMAEVIAGAQQYGYKLINTDELWERYGQNSEDLLIVDTRQEWEYRTGHIKDAVNFPMEPTWVARWQRKGDMEALLGQDRNRPVVFY